MIGENLRMAEIPGAILGAQVAKLPALMERIVRTTHSVREAVAQIKSMGVVQAAPERDRHSLGVLCYLPTPDEAERMAKTLQAEGVPAGKVYGGQPVYAAQQILKQWMIVDGCPFNCPSFFPEPIRYAMGMCPRSEDLLARSVMINTGPFYTEEDVDDIIVAVEKVAQHLL